MKRTKKLTVEEYHPTLKSFNLEHHIRNLVNREAWSLVDIPQAKIPVYKAVKVDRKWSAGIYNLVKQILP